MTVEEPKKGRVAAAILAGSALTFSSFAIGVPAAFANTESPAPEDPTEDASTEPEEEPTEDESPEPEEEPTEDESPEPEDDETDAVFAADMALTPGAGPAGSEVTVYGIDFTENGEIELSLEPVDAEDAEVIDLGSTEADEFGDWNEQVTIPEDTDNGRYYVTAYDVAEDDSVSHMFNVTDVTLTISPESIDLEEFHEGGQGVTLTVEDLEPGTEVDFQVAQEYADTELGGRATADSDGKAVLTVNAPTSSNYLGNYYVTVMDVEHHVEVARGTFEVTSDKP